MKKKGEQQRLDLNDPKKKKGEEPMDNRTPEATKGMRGLGCTPMEVGGAGMPITLEHGDKVQLARRGNLCCEGLQEKRGKEENIVVILLQTEREERRTKIVSNGATDTLRKKYISLHHLKETKGS